MCTLVGCRDFSLVCFFGLKICLFACKDELTDLASYRVVKQKAKYWSDSKNEEPQIAIYDLVIKGHLKK